MSETTQAEDPALEAKAREMCAAAGQAPDGTLRMSGKDVPRWRLFRMMAAKALQSERRQ